MRACTATSLGWEGGRFRRSPGRGNWMGVDLGVVRSYMGNAEVSENHHILCIVNAAAAALIAKRLFVESL